MQLIMQQQFAMKAAMEPGFNALRIRKPGVDDQGSSHEEYDDESEEPQSAEKPSQEDFAANKKRFAEQMKQELLAGKKQPAKKRSGSVVKLNQADNLSQ